MMALCMPSSSFRIMEERNESLINRNDQESQEDDETFQTSGSSPCPMWETYDPSDDYIVNAPKRSHSSTNSKRPVPLRQSDDWKWNNVLFSVDRGVVLKRSRARKTKRWANYIDHFTLNSSTSSSSSTPSNSSSSFSFNFTSSSSSSSSSAFPGSYYPSPTSSLSSSSSVGSPIVSESVQKPSASQTPSTLPESFCPSFSSSSLPTVSYPSPQYQPAANTQQHTEQYQMPTPVSPEVSDIFHSNDEFSAMKPFTQQTYNFWLSSSNATSVLSDFSETNSIDAISPLRQSPCPSPFNLNSGSHQGHNTTLTTICGVSPLSNASSFAPSSCL
eukprot:TRINITY_DN2051_c0_g1_i1.p1 TRINITY_DN2051_c0_g1~~TRINITY_DN2051_c0_g1_i1.p1  ORF type:complete len:330 (+),score=149.15 TRINITY_DN2051_c0_g1_i1:432-1421(+)